MKHKSPEIIRVLSEAPLYKKQGYVKARPAIPGEQIATLLKDGLKETVNTADDGDWVITNPSGEQYIVPKQKFFCRYTPTNKESIYAEKGYCRAVANPYGKPIEITASWESTQKGEERCFIADTCDANGKCDGEPYLIDADAFAETYKLIEIANKKQPGI